MKNKFNTLQKKYCNLENDFKTAFVVKTGWIYEDVKQQEATLIILNNTASFEDVYYLESDSSYRDPGGDMMAVLHESMNYYEPPVEGAQWYLKLDKELTDLYRGKLWFEIKKEIYERENAYNWLDKDEFLSNFNDSHYIIRSSKPVIHVFTSSLKND